MSFFEIIMLICFGFAWPAAIYKSWSSRTNKGKSLFFLIIVIMGYAAGMLHKYFYNMDVVFYLYLINMIMVCIDLCIYVRNHILETSVRRPGKFAGAH